MGTLVRVDRRGARATITLDSPANRNALSAALLTDLELALDQVLVPGVRVVVLDHAGPVFCAGADLKERSTGPADSSPMVRVIERITTSDAPVIAAVKGPVRAGGVGLMAACDLVVVDTSVTFAFTEVRIGVAPAIISVPVLSRCRWPDLAAPFLTGETFGAAAAARMGLVNEVTADVDGVVERWCGGVLGGAPGAVTATKRLLRTPATMAEMAVVSAELFSGAEAAEGMAAFFAKRSPSWAVGE